jgi:predicted nucleic acid-binding protein
MADTIYVLDANVFIEAARNYYPFDLVPAFWAVLETHSETERIKSIDRVLDELKKGRDELAEWAASEFADAFASTNEESTVKEFADVMNWAQAQAQFTDAAKAEFAQAADGWLVAYASAHGHTVVTHEVYSAEIQKKVKIPNVCQALGVPYVNTFDMLRGLGVRLA